MFEQQREQFIEALDRVTRNAQLGGFMDHFELRESLNTVAELQHVSTERELKLLERIGRRKTVAGIFIDSLNRADDIDDSEEVLKCINIATLLGYDKTKIGPALEDARKKHLHKIEERRRAAEEARLRAERERQRAEEARRRAEEEQRRREEAERLRQEEERRRAAEEARLRAERERQRTEEARRRAEEARKRAEEAARSRPKWEAESNTGKKSEDWVRAQEEIAKKWAKVDKTLPSGIGLMETMSRLKPAMELLHEVILTDQDGVGSMRLRAMLEYLTPKIWEEPDNMVPFFKANEGRRRTKLTNITELGQLTKTLLIPSTLHNRREPFTPNSNEVKDIRKIHRRLAFATHPDRRKIMPDANPSMDEYMNLILRQVNVSMNSLKDMLSKSK